jgi:hypothetical protein
VTVPDLDDFVPRLLAVIDETEQVARAANDGPWRVNDERYPESIYSADGTCVIGGGRWGGEARVFDSNEDALHIVRNDPEAVSRRCAADRRVVERHTMFHAIVPPVVLGDEPSTERYCTQCHAQRWPCPELLDRAQAYGVTVEKETTSG